jgi:hypothetical protein
MFIVTDKETRRMVFLTEEAEERFFDFPDKDQWVEFERILFLEIDDIPGLSISCQLSSYSFLPTA